MDMEKADYPQHLEAGLLVAPDGSEAPIPISGELPQPVRSGALPARTGSARRDGDLCPMGSEALEHAPGKEKSESESSRGDERKGAKILGMKRRTFWIGVIGVLLLVAAVVGGAIGGTRRVKKGSGNGDAQNAEGSQSSSTQPSSTSSSSAPLSTHNVGYRMQVWSDRNYTGRTQIFHNEGGYKLNFLAHSYHWFPGKYNDTWQCSTATCFDDEEATGWRGVTEKKWPGPPENATHDYGLVYLNLKCAANFEDPGCPGPADQTTYATIPVVETATPSLEEGASSTESTSVTRSGSSSARSTPARAGAVTPTPTPT